MANTAPAAGPTCLAMAEVTAPALVKWPPTGVPARAAALTVSTAAAQAVNRLAPTAVSIRS